MSDCRKCVDFAWCVEHEDCGLFKLKTQTNADRIRSMTDEELKEWFCEGHPNTCSGCPFDGIECTMLDWLKQEV